MGLPTEVFDGVFEVSSSDLIEEDTVWLDGRWRRVRSLASSAGDGWVDAASVDGRTTSHAVDDRVLRLARPRESR